MNEPKKTISQDDLFDALDDDDTCKVVSKADWRHGQRVTYKIEHEGRPYLVTLDVHTNEGVQMYGDTVKLVPARKATVTQEVWQADKEGRGEKGGGGT